MFKTKVTYLGRKAVTDEQPVLDFNGTDHVFRHRLVHHFHLHLVLLSLVDLLLFGHGTALATFLLFLSER